MTTTSQTPAVQPDASQSATTGSEPSGQTGTETPAQGTETPAQGTETPASGETSVSAEELVGALSDGDATTKSDGEDIEAIKRQRAESAREAKRLAKQAKAYQQLINSDPEVTAWAKENAAKLGLELDPAKDDDDETVSTPSKTEPKDPRVEVLIKERELETTAKFLSEHPVTPTVMKEMKPTIVRLKNAGFSHREALRLAYTATTGGNVKAETDKARNEAHAQHLTASQATTYTVPSSSSTANSSQPQVKLTQDEYNLAKKLGAVGADGKVRDSFVKQLQTVREQQ